jgi:hypothetical protein
MTLLTFRRHLVRYAKHGQCNWRGDQLLDKLFTSQRRWDSMDNVLDIRWFWYSLRIKLTRDTTLIDCRMYWLRVGSSPFAYC